LTTFVVVGTGESLTHAQIDHVHSAYLAGACRAVAVNNAYKLMPWASALVGNDRIWWQTNPDALKFAGPKYCAGVVRGTERLPPEVGFPSDCNSGLQGMRVAAMLGASRILLIGFDLHGSHYFGKHPAPLRNTTIARFKVHLRQFKRWRGPEVINCTPGSALTQFPMSTLEKDLVIDERSVA
jgi:hypothetical protein